ncbi:acidic phospholipase A2 [Lingula anatina]|uniref:Phospholipase A2 n=1 Tax=Lingula anatina TaxID=7574 RepID=A0A1S3J3H6_LINAN|nr:acidic phospholipase A2 [Lingula anatina]|eukprot:XP_013404821.1 acidic phospholipase A2 [Lingula anatina]
MKITIGLFAIAALVVLADTKPRPRNLVQFALMVNKATGRSALDFNDYGCYCGLGGKGKPVDDLDKCCKVHDFCYEMVSHEGCWNAKVGTYDYRTNGTDITCDYYTNDNCDYMTCECDRVAALCFASNTYNDSHKAINRDGFCSG